MIGRRKALKWLAALTGLPHATALARSHDAPITNHRSPITPFEQVVPGHTLRFPQDEGSHPDFRIEWWYVTGWLAAGDRPLGFQVTFFRARPRLEHANPSAFTPRQVFFAHAGLSDPRAGKLVHAQRAARGAFGLAGAAQGRMRVWLDDWSLAQHAGRYSARIAAREFTLDLGFETTQAPLLQGAGGYSRKGPSPASASYYYSLPQLQVSGTIARARRTEQVTGHAWLDHEWSSQYMDENAEGWDWIGINLDDGGALMAFRMRDKQGGSLWAGGALRARGGDTQALSSGQVRFTPRRRWRSPRTGARYPVAFTVRAGALKFDLEPLMDDQENDTRATTGTVYWEGAVQALVKGKRVGAGYLELTGYWRRLDL